MEFRLKDILIKILFLFIKENSKVLVLLQNSIISFLIKMKASLSILEMS